MFEKLKLLYRYVTAVATTYIAPEPPDDELVGARLVSLPPAPPAPDEDVLALVIGWLAAKSVGLDPAPSWALDKRLVLEYKHKGAGPFAFYFDPSEPVGFPPKIEELLSVDDVIVMAEGPKEEDLTEIATKFAGPDGKFGGRIDRKGASWGKFDAKLIVPTIEKDEAVTITYSNGDELVLKYAPQTTS